jgi:hypothetical protein
MKKIFIAGILLLAAQHSFSQNALEALRFSYLTPVGSARINAIGGANVSLGGDISSTFINPAGLAQFKTNEFVFTPGFFMNRANMNYNDTGFKNKRNAVNTGAGGLVMSWGNRWNSSRVKNTTIGLAFNQMANFNSNFNYSGQNVESSFSEKWVDQLVDLQVDDFGNALSGFPDGASLAVENYLVDTISVGGSIVGYRSNAQIRGNLSALNQSFAYETRGGMYEAAFGIAWNNNDKFLYGLSFGMPIVNFNRNTTVQEQDATGNTNNDFGSLRFTEKFSTTGIGVNAKLGIIYKPVEYFRLGLTFHTPSVLVLTDKTDATLFTDVENYARRITGDPNRSSTFTMSTKDVTGGDDFTYTYQLITPWRVAASASYVFREINDVTKQKAFITGDVELVNYKSMSYSSNEEVPLDEERAYFRSINDNIDEIYRMAINARIGGEVKFKTWMVRGGFQYQGSPYNKNAFPDGVKGHRLVPSLGLGYRDKGVFVDLTYAHTIGRDVHIPYTLTQVPGEDRIYPLANNRFNNGQVVATVGFKF